MKPDGHRTSLIESFGYAFEGIAASARGRNFRIMLGFAVAAVALGLAFRISMLEWLAVIICIGLVLGGECANTALEALVDLASPDAHPLAKQAKDAAAGCMVLFSLASFAVGFILFAPRIWGVLFP